MHGLSPYDKPENCKISGQREELTSPGEAGQRLLFLNCILPSVIRVTFPWADGTKAKTSDSDSLSLL